MVSSPSSLRCVLVGAQSVLIQCGELLRGAGHTIAAVVSEDPAVLRWAAGAGLRCLAPRNDLAAELAGEAFDYLFSLGNLRVLPEEVLALAQRGAINFHDGPLPCYAGVNAPAWALLRGETSYGISFHQLSAGLDEGALLAQRHFEISPGETSLSLNAKCLQAALEAFAALLPELALGRAQPRAQDLTQRSYFARAQRPRAAAVLQWSRPAAELEALVRALDFGPYENPFAAARLLGRGRAFAVRRAQAVPREQACAPGTLLELSADALVVAAGEGALRILELETPGGMPLPLAELGPQLGCAPGEPLEALSPALAEALEARSAALAESEPFWRRRLAALVPLELPYAQSAPLPAHGSAVHTRALAVPAALCARWVPPLGGAADAALAAACAYLARLSRQERFDAALCEAAAPADAPAIAAGLAADWVPLRIAAPLAHSAAQFMTDCAAELARVRARGRWLCDAVGRSPQLRAQPLLREGRRPALALEVSRLEEPARLAPGVELLLRVSPDGAQLELCACAQRIAPEHADAMRDQLALVLAQLVEQPPATPLRTLRLLGPRERERVTRQWNGSAAPYPRERCIHELVAEQARRTPEAQALVCGERSCSYRELDARSERLAALLRARGVGPDQRVGIHLERSLELVIALLGVLKAGGAYVPIDPEYPAERIAFVLGDCGARWVITQESLAGRLPPSPAALLHIERELALDAGAAAPLTDPGVRPSHLAYVIYTSGSTGQPKGVLVEHRNVVNFFAGMDAHVGTGGEPGVWLAVTSLSFDISVLELLWTLTRGFCVVIQRESPQRGARPARPLAFGLFMWGDDEQRGPHKYALTLECARFADQHGFASFWTPERHFHAFGGPYPNPSVVSAAVAAVTERVAIRAGSCVLPLHHPLRVAEEWAVVDNLSGGRVGISFASGWQPNDFVLRPENHAQAKAVMLREIDTVRRLWRGEAVAFPNAAGELVPITTQPRPVQAELPFWVTSAGNADTFRQAGALGANVLTHLLGQNLEQLAEKIRAYREARAAAGLDPRTGSVTLMLHTLVGADDEQCKQIAREPLKQYLRSALALLKDFAWAFPAFRRPGSGGEAAAPADVDLGALSAQELDELLEFAFLRYFESSGLFGGLDRALATVERVRAADVDEIACLMDYGISAEHTREGLRWLAQLRQRANPAVPAEPAEPLSIPALIQRHGVTHLQCTPSLARILVGERDAGPALKQLRQLLIGGEPLPPALAAQLDGVLGGTLTNMYGPTETTIWSACERVVGRPERIAIGRPLANQRLYVVDEVGEPLPVGVAGELWIGGEGVARGYHERPELSAERFGDDPFAGVPGARVYRSGDRARWLPDGRVECLGRIDSQVKLRGYRIELGEIEAQLARHPAVAACAVAVREDVPGDQRLVAYVVPRGPAPRPEALRAHLGQFLPEFMVPSAFGALDALPLTPNGKLDRRALPPLGAGAPAGPRAPRAEPASGLEREIAQVWKEVLKLQSVGRSEGFFELGGHSLLVVQAHRLLRERLARPLTLTDLYRFPTVAALAEHLEGGSGQDGAARGGEERAERRRRALAQRGRRRADVE